VFISNILPQLINQLSTEKFVKIIFKHSLITKA